MFPLPRHPGDGGWVRDGLRGHHRLKLLHVQFVTPRCPVDMDPLLLDPGDEPGPLDPLVQRHRLLVLEDTAHYNSTIS